MAIPRETVEQILQAARIEEVVGEFVTLKKRGSNLIGVCPFHNEKTPSFNVNPARNIFKCFGCGKAGDSAKFLMEHEHFTYPEALRYLAKKYNIKIEEKEQTPEELMQQSVREKMFNINEFANKYFTDSLWNNEEGKTVGLALLAAVPAFSQEGKTLVFVPQWEPQAQFAGYYAAQELGFYAEEGLEVSIEHPFTTQSVEMRVRENPDQAVMLPLDEAIRLVDAGIPLVNIFQTSMNSPLAIATFNGNDPHLLDHPKVAVWSTGYDCLIRAWAFNEQLDWTWIWAATTPNLLVADIVDAAAVTTYNECFRLQELGHPAQGEGLYRLADHGYNIQQEGVYMTREAYLAHKDEADAFVRASRRGWDWVRENPAKALDYVMEVVEQHRVATNRFLQWRMLEEVLRLQVDADSGLREYRLRPDMVARASRLLYEADCITREITFDELMP